MSRPAPHFLAGRQERHRGPDDTDAPTAVVQEKKEVPSDVEWEELVPLDPLKVSWTLKRHPVEMSPNTSGCLDVKFGFKLRVEIKGEQKRFPASLQRCDFHVDEKHVFDFKLIGAITRLGEDVAVETTTCLREFDQFNMRSCADFYNSLHSKLLRVILYPSVDELRIEASFESLGLKLWSYPSPTDRNGVMSDVSHLVFEAFRNFVDVSARLSYNRGNALLLACRNAALTVPQVQAVCKELEKTLIQRRYYNGQILGYEDNVVVAALAPLHENLRNAIRLHELMARPSGDVQRETRLFNGE